MSAIGPPPILDLSAISKGYGALRPLRIQRFLVQPGESVALIGLDQPAAEVFINLVTGASLPDTGTVRVDGRDTAQIADGSEWLQTLDFFGIVSDRSALLEMWSVVQNLAVPFSLDVEPPSDDLRERAVGLAREVGLAESSWDCRIGDLAPADRLRVRLARALALGPSVLLLEHPSAMLARHDVQSLGRHIRTMTERRHVAAITLTMDEEFAAAVSGRWVTLDAATGKLKEGRLGRMRFWS